MANNILRFPDGSGCRPWVISSVRIEDSGVGGYDINGFLHGCTTPPCTSRIPQPPPIDTLRC